MEFKLQEKWRVEQELSLSPSQMDKAIKRMIKRHPYESWVQVKYSLNGEKITYLRLEFVEWLKEVYLKRKPYYLDLEIKFFQKQINRLEKELNITSRKIKYKDMTIKELCSFFSKGQKTIWSSVSRMCKYYDASLKYIKNKKTYVSSSGVKWLNENYFRNEYMTDLELYKIELQKKKREIHTND